jgi:hypothetical protein
MKKAKGIFEELYRFDEKTGAYIIEIALDKYSDIFSEWDPAPFKLRDIDHDLELYLEGCSDDIPYRYPLILSFTIPMGERDINIEQQACKGLRNGFKFKIYFIKKAIARTNARTLLFMMMASLFCGLPLYFQNNLPLLFSPLFWLKDFLSVDGCFCGKLSLWLCLPPPVLPTAAGYIRDCCVPL